MSLGFSPQRVDGLRFDAKWLVERLRDQEAQLEMFVASAEGDSRQAEAAVSLDASALVPHEVRHLLVSQLERRIATASAGSRLLVETRQQHAAARHLLHRVDGGDTDGQQAGTAVLVVDDYAAVRDLLTRVLGAGLAVRTAANGLEALIAACEIGPDVIVMDMSMPVLDGIQATRLIKAEPSTREARVIAFTGNASASVTGPAMGDPATPVSS